MVVVEVEVEVDALAVSEVVKTVFSIPTYHILLSYISHDAFGVCI